MSAAESYDIEHCVCFPELAGRPLKRLGWITICPSCSSQRKDAIINIICMYIVPQAFIIKMLAIHSADPEVAAVSAAEESG